MPSSPTRMNCPIAPPGRVYLGLMAVSGCVMVAWLGRRDPAPLAARLAPPVHRDQEPWDRLFMTLFMAAFLGWMVLIGLDARRFSWSHVPVWLEAFGGAGIPPLHGRHLAELRGQQLRRAAGPVEGGPRPSRRLRRALPFRPPPDVCRRAPLPVRDAAAARLVVGFFVALFLAIGLAARAAGEERLLRRELAGYDAYMRQVRFRLIPGVW